MNFTCILILFVPCMLSNSTSPTFSCTKVNTIDTEFSSYMFRHSWGAIIRESSCCWCASVLHILDQTGSAACINIRIPGSAETCGKEIVYRVCLLLVHEKSDTLNSRWTAPDRTVMHASVIFVLHCFFFLEFCYANLILIDIV